MQNKYKRQEQTIEDSTLPSKKQKKEYKSIFASAPNKKFT
jgi:hypothetical protein